jgi:DNA-binding NtrC family response regulator
MAKILVVDDNPDILDALDLLLSLHDYEVITANNKKDAVLAVSRQHVDLIIQDMNFTYSATSGDEGLSLFYEIQNIKPDIPIVLITAWSHLDKAVELVKAGAVDYLQKPWDDRKLLDTIAKYVNNMPSTIPAATPNPFIVFSPVMLELQARAEKVAQSDINVLITGANGAGKEKLADHIHQHSARNQQPFVKVNMGALPHDLMEAELFGAEKGAFTGANEQRIGRFEAANGGTLFLDEIGNLTLSGQMKLLRVLQTGEFERVGSSKTQKVDVRVISATNANLPQAIKNGEFREDLFYRLNVVELHLPPLKDRKEDIIPLAEHFIGATYQLTSSAKTHLLAQPWSGNVRELQNACQRACVFSQNNQLDAAAFSSHSETSISSEKERIEQALQKHQGVIKHAAQELGLSRQALYRRLEKYQIKVD